MKKFLSVLVFILSAIRGLSYNLEFSTFTCELNKQTLSLNLKGHPKFVIAGGFSVAFWFKYRNVKNQPLISIDTLDGTISVEIDDRRRLKIGPTASSLSELVPSNFLNDFVSGNIQGNWYYFALSLKTDGTKVNSVTLSLSLNYRIQENIVVDTPIDQRQLFLVLGARNKYSNCLIEALFYQFYLFDSPLSFLTIDLKMLSTGFAQPILLSKFELESPYTKVYTNLIPSGIGDIRNGADMTSFTMYSSLSTANNAINRQSNLANDLGVFFLPSKMLPPYQVNSSYIFLIQYNFFYKDYLQSSFDNMYYHVLYQRMPANGVNRLIRVDFQMVMNPTDAFAYLRYMTNDKVNKQTPYLLTLERTGGLRTVFFNYLIIKITQTAIDPNPEITFINGYDDTKYIARSNVVFQPNDQHIIGDYNQEDASRREFLSFISINEVAFFNGAYLIEEKLKTSPVSYYSGVDKQITVLTCKSTNNPKRINNDGKELFDTCDPFVKESKLSRMHID